jgi:hypothetical protein
MRTVELQEQLARAIRGATRHAAIGADTTSRVSATSAGMLVPAPDDAPAAIPASAPGTATAGLSIAERIARLRPRQPPARGKAIDPQQLALSLGGVLDAPGVVRIDSYLDQGPAGSAIGSGTATDLAPLPSAMNLRRDHLHALGLTALENAGSLVFLDTETNGLAGGAGTLAWMIGAGRIEAHGFAIRQWMLLGPAAERDMLTLLERWLRPDSTIVTYNGRTFDLPLLATRYCLNRMRDPLAARPHLDLLATARSLPREGTPDLKLTSVERAWLGVCRADDLPGSAAPGAWRNWLQGRDAGALPGVLKHNAIDIESLARLCLHAGRIRAGLFDDRRSPRADSADHAEAADTALL